MNKTCSLLFSFMLVSMLLNAQNKPDKPANFLDNVRFGGSINMAFGNNHSFFSIAPSAIYDFSEQFSSGLSLKYMYFKNKSTVQKTTNLYGGSILSLFRPMRALQLSVEYEQLKMSDKQVFQEAVSMWQSALFIGAEYVTGNVSMGLRYDVLYDPTSLIYPSALTPVFRVYF